MTPGSLVGRAAAGDQRAWEQLVGDLGHIPWGVARALDLSRGDAQAVVTVTWLRLVDRLDRFTADDDVASWLVATAYRETTRWLSARTPPRFREKAPAGARVAAGEYRPTGEDGEGRLYLAYLSLPGRCRLLLRLVLSSHLHYRQISDALEMPIGSIGPTRQRCFVALRRALEDTGDRLR